MSSNDHQQNQNPNAGRDLGQISIETLARLGLTWRDLVTIRSALNSAGRSSRYDGLAAEERAEFLARIDKKEAAADSQRVAEAEFVQAQAYDALSCRITLHMPDDLGLPESF